MQTWQCAGATPLLYALNTALAGKATPGVCLSPQVKLLMCPIVSVPKEQCIVVQAT